MYICRPRGEHCMLISISQYFLLNNLFMNAVSDMELISGGLAYIIMLSLRGYLGVDMVLVCSLVKPILQFWPKKYMLHIIVYTIKINNFPLYTFCYFIFICSDATADSMSVHWCGRTLHTQCSLPHKLTVLSAEPEGRVRELQRLRLHEGKEDGSMKAL